MRACVCRLASRLLRCDLRAEYHKSDERKECRLRTFRYFSTLFFLFDFFLLLSVLTCKCFMITIVTVIFASIIVIFSSDCSVCINNDD